MKIKMLILFLLTIGMFSCSNEDGSSFSCNKEVDTWVKNHLVEIQSMDRMDWLNIDNNLKIATFRAFTKKQKIEFWNNKLTQALDLDWNEKEKTHIIEVISFINSHSEFFASNKLTEEQENLLELFFYNWMKYSLDTLNWDKKVVYALVGTGYPLKDKTGALDTHSLIENSVEKLTADSENGSELMCNCKIDYLLSCFPDTHMECKDEDCYDNNKLGCGWLWLEACTGRCG